MRTNEDLAVLLEECKRTLDGLGIRYGTVKGIRFTRMTSSFGLCHYHLSMEKEMFGQVDYAWITINSCWQDEHTSLVQLRNTVMHELLHTCSEDRILQHGEDWVKLARYVQENSDYLMLMTEYDSFEIMNMDPLPAPSAVCSNCGTLLYTKEPYHEGDPQITKCHMCRGPRHWIPIPAGDMQ